MFAAVPWLEVFIIAAAAVAAILAWVILWEVRRNVTAKANTPAD